MDSNKKLTCDRAKKIPIVNFLARLGFQPEKKGGNDYYYKSPLRDDDHKPSFRVNLALNLYFDYGTGKGGSIIDLGINFFNCSVPEFLTKLSDLNLAPNDTQIKTIDNSIKILDTKPLASPALIQYLKERAIKIDIAKQYCQEVSYEVNNKKYFAIGFKNSKNGYELRNKYFKGSSSPKDITIIRNDSKSLCIWEGFIDFLSWPGSNLEMLGKFDFLILNSVAFLSRCIDIITDYKEIYLFLDNDNAGTSAASKIKSLGHELCYDMSTKYKDYKDLNEYLVNKTHKARILKNHPVKKRGMSM